jgi:hypothetical protein
MAPQVPQTPALVQPRPPVHGVLPLQHTAPAAPQVAQVLLIGLHARVEPLQVWPAQHTAPAAPHAAHVPMLQASPVPVHVPPPKPPPQHGSPAF